MFVGEHAHPLGDGDRGQGRGKHLAGDRAARAEQRGLGQADPGLATGEPPSGGQDLAPILGAQLDGRGLLLQLGQGAVSVSRGAALGVL